MPRPVRCRRVCVSPTCTYFKPAGIPVSQLQESVVAVDELEALRLADVEGSYHEQAAEQMGAKSLHLRVSLAKLDSSFGGSHGMAAGRSATNPKKFTK